MVRTHRRRIFLLALAAGAVAAVAPTGVASAGSSLPPCNPPAFTGGAVSAGLNCVPTCTCTGQRGPRGRRGLTGARGARGLPGAGGGTGQTGPRGLPGEAGATGPAGPTGPTGDRGPQGQTGQTGSTGQTGPTGSTGQTGPQGSVGPTGPAGTNGLAEYGYVFNLLGQTVAIEADIPFDSNGLLTAGITHAPGNAGIAVVGAGIYKIDFSVSGTEPSQFAVFVNGAVAPGSTYGSGAGTQQSTGQVILALGAGDVVTIRNHSSAAAVTLQTLAGGTQVNVNASVAILKLA
jgi:hypothetical protein